MEVIPEDYYIHGRKKAAVLVGLALTLFVSALDSTIVAVTLPTIGAAFNNYQQTSWVVSVYLLTYTSFLPIVSKMTDIFGRRLVLVPSTLFFMLWSGACGGSKSLTQLIVFRALQGIGGSAIYSGVIVTISTMVPREKVTQLTPIIGAVFATASVTGPIIGGAIVENIHWSWIFFVNLPIGAVGVIFLTYGLDDPKHERMTLDAVRRRIDWVGCFFILASTAMLAYALQVGGTSGYPWKSATVLVPLIISICLMPVVLWVETKHKEPVIPLRLFGNRNMSIAFFYSFALGAGMYALIIYLPQRMQIIDAVDPMEAGIRMIPLIATIGFISPFAGAIVLLTNTYRLLICTTSIIAPIGAGLLSTLAVPTKLPNMFGFECMPGISMGITITVSTIIVQFCSERRDLATATGFQTFSRFLGSLVGITVSTAVLNTKTSSMLLANPAFSSSLVDEIILSPTTVIKTLDSAGQLYVRNTYSDAYSKVFISGAAWFAAGAVATIGLKHQLPETRSRPQQAEEHSGGDVEKGEGAST